MPFDIRKRRVELGLTLEEIGRFVGVGKGTVAKWESGFIKNMRRDKIVKLAEILDTPPVRFLMEEVSSPSPAEQKKVPLNEELKKEYQDFILSVFGTLNVEDTALVYTDDSLVLLNNKNIIDKIYLP